MPDQTGIQGCGRCQEQRRFCSAQFPTSPVSKNGWGTPRRRSLSLVDIPDIPQLM